jgi:hypothetical protein
VPEVAPEHLEHRDRSAPGVEIGGDAVADADAGHDQRAEAHQGQELAEPVEEAARARARR